MNPLVALLLCLVPVVAFGAGASGASGMHVVAAAREQIGVTTNYDPRYVVLAYPKGDVPIHTGVCSDVVVRALRKVGLDLQKEVHEDMRAHFTAYPQKWGLKKPDRNIDHRRVPNLMRYFERHHTVISDNYMVMESYRPGDIVAWDLGKGVLHIGIVSDRTSERRPLIIHNIGAGTKEEDILLTYKVIGHYRIKEQVRSGSLRTKPQTAGLFPAPGRSRLRRKSSIPTGGRRPSITANPTSWGRVTGCSCSIRYLPRHYDSTNIVNV